VYTWLSLRLEDIGTVMTNGNFDSAKAKAYMKDLGVGKFDSYGRNTDSIFGNQVQRAILESSEGIGGIKGGIGGILSEECQHGVQGDWHTIFPSPYTIAATFDRQLLGLIGEVIGTEARAGGTAECWSPVCGLAREPRWCVHLTPLLRRTPGKRAL
jgi:beta-glucosidase-like glycosyl hydrolase